MRTLPYRSSSSPLARLFRLLVCAGFPLFTACIFVFQKIEPTEVQAAATVVRNPVRAHMHDGSIVTFAQGATFGDGIINGIGRRHHPSAGTTDVRSVQLDSVIGVESFSTVVQPAQTFLVSAAATAVAAVALAAAALAVFGSCPTFYSDSAGTPVLQAEAFSYAIAPMFEHRDMDRLRLTPGPDGIVRLEVRNEALETHYINHLELLEVTHSPDDLVVSTEGGSHLALRTISPVSDVLNRAGNDVTVTLLHEDGDVYATPPAFAAARTAADLDDYIEFTVRAPQDVDSVAILLRLRNSLLNTVLLYDEMLAAAGPQALEWVGQDLTRIATALELADWYTTHMGMKVQVLQDGEYRQVARIWDIGPIAFHDVAVPVRVGSDGTARVRLVFVADNWRIDRIASSADFRRVTARTIALTGAHAMDGTSEDAALRNLAAPDEEYLVTLPGHRFVASFDAGTSGPGTDRTFFLASQGYYSEWMRPDWLRTDAPQRFTPTADRLHSALERWLAKRDVFEQQFYASKVPVR